MGTSSLAAEKTEDNPVRLRTVWPLCSSSDSAAVTPSMFVAQNGSDQSIVIHPGSFPSIGVIDERFQSYNVEMAEIIGGDFWKPYGVGMGQEVAARSTAPLGQGFVC